MGDFLFGSSEDPTISQASTLTSGQSSLLNSLTTLLQNQLGTGVNSYGGTYTPGASETQQTQYDYIQSLFDQSGENTPLTTLNSILQPYDKESATEYWEQAVKAPAMATWDDLKAQTLEPFAGMDALDSGASRRALADAAVDLNTNISGQLADVLYQGEQSHLNRQVEGMNYSTNLLSALNVPGATQREIASEQGQEEYNDWLTEQSYNNPWLQYLSTGLNTNAFENVASGGDTQGSLGSVLAGLGGLFGGLFG